MSNPSLSSNSKRGGCLRRFQSWFPPSSTTTRDQPLQVTFDQPLQVTFDQPLQVTQNVSGGGLIDALHLKARNEAVEYISANMGEALIFGYREALWNYALKKAHANFKEFGDGEIAGEENFTIAEFGVWEGYSINYIAQRYPKAAIFGFDSFEGLEEDWTGHNLVQGHFNLEGRVPLVENNVTLVKGWFKDTIPLFVNQYRSIHLVHFDSDTYTPTSTVLDYLGDSLADRCIFIFDEYLNFPGWKNHEFKAFAEFISRNDFDYKYIGVTDFQQVAVQLSRNNRKSS
jgi:hypothetical protein